MQLAGALCLLLLITAQPAAECCTLGCMYMHSLLLRVGAAATAWVGHGLQAAEGCLAGPLADNSNSLPKSLQLLHGNTRTR